MEPRSDSKLTELFCKNELSEFWTAEVVAKELFATNYVFQNTLYGETIEDFMRLVAEKLRKKHRLSWTDTWKIVRFYAPIALKLLSLERCGTAIPQL